MQQKLAIAYLMAIAMLLQSRLSFPNTGGITIFGDTLRDSFREPPEPQRSINHTLRL
jgi:hypothetical protein